MYIDKNKGFLYLADKRNLLAQNFGSLSFSFTRNDLLCLLCYYIIDISLITDTFVIVVVVQTVTKEYSLLCLCVCVFVCVYIC